MNRRRDTTGFVAKARAIIEAENEGRREKRLEAMAATDGNPPAEKPSNPRVKRFDTNDAKLEVRVPTPSLVAFKNICERRGTTMSAVVRGLVESYIDAYNSASDK